MQQVAEALGCTFVHALVPPASLEDTLTPAKLRPADKLNKILTKIIG